MSNSSVISFIKDWSPIIGLAVAGGIAWGLTQGRINNIEDNINEIKSGAEMEARQWKKITDNGGEISSHEQRLKEIERHIDPRAVQEYGALKSMVIEDHRLLIDHLQLDK